MNDTGRTKRQLLSELAALRQQVAALEAAAAGRQRAEEALRQAPAELERRVEERTAELAGVNRMLKILSNCNQVVIRATDETTLLQEICRIIADLGGYPWVWVGLAEHNAAKSVRPVARVGFEEGYLNTANMTWADAGWGRGPTGTAIRTGKPCVARDIRTDPHFTAWREAAIRRGYVSSIALPLRGDDGQVSGALNIYATQPDAFHTAEVDLLMELAGDLAYGITSLRARAERKRAEDELRRLKEFNEGIVQSMAEGIAVEGEDGYLTFANPAAAEMLGYTPEELTGQHWTAFVPTDQQPIIDQADERRKRGESDRYEVELVRKDGTRVPVLISGSPRFEGSKFAGTLAVFTDITQQERTEAALCYRQRELGSLLETSRDLSSVLDLHELLSLMAQRALSLLRADECVLFRLSADGATLQPALAVGEFADEMMAAPIEVSKGITGYSVAHNQPVLANHAQSDPRAEHVPGTPVGEPEHIMVAPLIFRDKTSGAMLVSRLVDQPFTEEELDLLVGYARQAAVAMANAQLHAATQERATRLELVGHVSQKTTAILDLDELLHQAVRLIGDTFGYYNTIINLVDGDELVLAATALPALQPLEKRDRIRIGVEGITGWVAAHGEPLVVPDVSQDPRYYFVQEARETQSELAVPIKLRDEVIGVLDVQSHELDAFSQVDVFTLQTIADQLAIAIRNARLYEQVQCYAEELEQRVAERTAELSAANQHLHALSRIKDEFVSNVSHELRTPIASLKLYLHMLDRRPDRRASYVATLERETRRLEDLIENLLFLSCLDQGRVAMSPTPVDLNTLVGEYVTDRLPLAESKGLTLMFKAKPGLPTVEADPHLLGQVLSILLTNAFNYTPAGGQVTVCTRTRRFAGRRWTGFSVSDTGPGIPPEEEGQLFTRFFRGQVGRASGAPGTGLGLSIAQEIVERHHGRIELDGTGVLSKGATFCVWLPVQA